MTDRVATITGTQAGKAFPRLARFLAENTSIALDVAELAVRAACQDYASTEEAVDIKASWTRAVRQAQGFPPETITTETAAVAVDPVRAGWAKALQRANGGLGA